MKIAIIDYKAGNIRSVISAVENLGANPILTSDAQIIKNADKVIFPGVGNAKPAMEALISTGLDKVIVNLKQPVLGICLGMQLMCKKSEEGDTNGLGIFDVNVEKFIPKNNEKIPHMGWNNIYNLKSDIFSGVNNDSFMYFVHSYRVPVFEHSAAICNYIEEFSASIHKDNFYGCQFHPEKSAKSGLQILENFIKL